MSVLSQTIKNHIHDHPFFHELDGDLLNCIVTDAHYQDFDRGHFLISDGQPADHFYLIVSGSVGIELTGKEGNPVLIQSLRENDIVGWSWLIPPYRWQFDALG